MADETIRNNLVNAINDMTRLLETSISDDQRFELRLKIRELFRRLDQVVVATLESGTPEFDDALASIKSLSRTSREAKEDLGKLEEVLTRATETVAKVEKLVKNVVGVMV